MSDPVRILTGMVIGVLSGFVVRATVGDRPEVVSFLTTTAYFLGQLFLRLIFMVVVPLVVSSLVMGVAELGDIRRLGRIGLRCLVYTMVLSMTSVIVGIVAVGVVRPGEMIAPETREKLHASGAEQATRHIEDAGKAKKPVDIVLGLIPKNPVQAASLALEGEMIALMVFALLAGVALSLCDQEKVRPLLAVTEGVLSACMMIIQMAMKMAPVGVGALLFNLVVQTGGALFVSLAGYVLVVVGSLLFQQLVVYSLFLAIVARVSPIAFFGKIRESMLTAFSTASSSATLPVSLRVSEKELGIPRQIGNFVLTVGATANQNGTALFEGVTVLFLAQVFGIQLAFDQQVQVVLMSVLAGVGTAGVPGGSIPLIVIVLQQVGVPPEGIGLILGVDRFLDMCRTTLNVSGDLVIAQLVAAGEKVVPVEPVPAV